MSGFDPVLWAMKDAPVVDVEEWATLVAVAEFADEDGCNAYPSTKTISERTRISERTVQRRLDQLEGRGLIVRGDQSNIAANIPLHKRPTLYDVMVPAAWWGDGALDRVNRGRANKGLRPLTEADRPSHAPAPAKKARRDAGVARTSQGETQRSPGAHPERAEAHGVTTSHRVTESHRVTTGRDRGDLQSPVGVSGSHPTFPRNLPQELSPSTPPPPVEDDEPVASADADGETPDAFEQFWTTYPRRVGKTDARKAWNRATRDTDPDEILAGVHRFAADPNLPPKDEARFIPHPATWLNRGSWGDDPLPPRGNGRRAGSNLIVDSSIDPDDDIFGFDDVIR